MKALIKVITCFRIEEVIAGNQRRGSIRLFIFSASQWDNEATLS
jgi:hypothetical protein